MTISDLKKCSCGKGAYTFGVLAAVLLLTLIVWMGLLARNAAREYRYIGVPEDIRNTFTVTGKGEVTVIPDVATVNLGTTIERKRVVDAQEENTRIMNEILDALEDDYGIDKKDLRTSNYSISPQYDWREGVRDLRGYMVSQNVEVKIRDFDDIGDILQMAAVAGATNVGGVTFTTDDPEAAQDEARTEAFEDAREKAEELAALAGVKIRAVSSFSESSGNAPPPYPVYYMKEAGIGGGGAAPSVEAGSQDIVVNVSITYEIE